MLFEELEKTRKKSVNIVNFVIVLLTILIVYFAFIFNKNKFLMIYIIGFILLSVVIIVILISNLNKRYNTLYKRFLYNNIKDNNIFNLIYEPTKGFDLFDIERANILRKSTTIDSSDYINGVYNNIAFEQAIIDTYILPDFDEGETQVFKGKWMIFKLNKMFNFNLQIIQKGFHQSFNSIITGSFLEKDIFGESSNKYTKLRTDNEMFNKSFNTYVNTPNNIFLNTTLIENICNLNCIVSGKLIFSFINDELHVGIHNSESVFGNKNIFKRIKEENILLDIKNELEIIKNVINGIVLGVN